MSEETKTIDAPEPKAPDAKENTVPKSSAPPASPPPPADKKVTSEDLDFISDCRAAFLQEKMTYANVAIVTIIAFVLVFVVWANFAEVDEITRGQGTVIPSASVHLVQNLEGGIVKEFYTEQGATVEKGQKLLQIDATAFQAAYNETETKLETLLATTARLKAEIDATDSIEFPSSIVEKRQDLVESATLLFNARRNSQTAKVEHSTSSLALKQREWDITKPLADSGVVSQIELLRLETAVNDANSQLKQVEADYMSELVTTYNESSAQINQLKQSIQTYQDKVLRSTVLAPISGIVNEIHIQNIGGIIRAGEPIIEIVPIEGGLLVEADITPQDIAFIHEGMDATVKITAYDFSIYGGLRGKVEQIGADTLTNEKGDQFYKVRVKTGDRSLDNSGQEMPVMPGMVVQLDILTGKKTVLQYLLKPLFRAKMNAFSER